MRVPHVGAVQPEAPGSAEIGARHACSLKYSFVKSGVPEVGTVHLRVVEKCLVESRPPQDRPTEICTSKSHCSRQCPYEACFPQIGLSKLGLVEVRTR